MNRAQTMTQDVSALLRARNTLLWIVTREEARAERSLTEAAKATSYDVMFWDCAAGTTNAKGETVDRNGDPQAVLAAIRDSEQRQLWILRDMPQWIRDPMVLRLLRNLARTLPNAEKTEARSVVILSPSAEVPPELAGHAVVIDWPLPDREEIAALLNNVIVTLPPDIANKITAEVKEAAIDAAVGLTAEEAASCYAKSLVTIKTIDPKIVATEKKRVIARERVLEWFDPDPRGFDAVGGLENLKQWLKVRRPAFSQRARNFGLPAPRGLMIVGQSGCGKSLTAKAIASAWGIPLLRLDLGALKSKYVGDSESNIRKALAVAEAVSPVILWCDEIEKALGGAVQGAADGGVSSDALGCILSWMQERKGSAFVVATANDISALPPELLRKGRFDEIFFVDLPTVQERREILNVSLKQHKRLPETIDLAMLDAATENFTGAEIAALVPEALFVAFADSERDITTHDLLNAAKTVVPLAKTAAERIKRVREWAQERARPASATHTKENVSDGRKLDL